MNKIDRVAIKEIIEHDQTTSLTIDTYLSAIAIAKLDSETGYPTIHNFTRYKLYKSMKDKMDWINESSIYLVFDRLLEMGFFHHDQENKELWILNSGTGHIASDENYSNKGYITMHHFFFNRAFYNLSLVAKKMALMVASRIGGDALNPVKINFLVKRKPKDELNKLRYEDYCEIFKTNRPAHIRAAIKELKKVGLFTISELEHGTVQFALNTISKALIVGTDKLFNFTQEQLNKTTKMLKEASKGVVAFKEQHIKQVCEAIKDYSMEFARKVCKELCKTDRGNVRNLLGYTKSIVERLKHNPA